MKGLELKYMSIEHVDSKKIYYKYLTLFLIVITILLWISGADWGKPFGFHPDELQYLTRIIDDPPVPIWTTYGRWPIYFQKIMTWILAIPPTDLYFARYLSVLVSASGIVATGLATKDLAGWKGALLTTAFISGAPAVVQAAHFFITDVWLWAGLSWSLFFCLRIIKEHKWRNVVGLGIAWGLSIGSKLTGLFLLPTVIFVCFLAWKKHWWKGGVIIGTVAGLTALLGQPTLLVHGIDAYLIRGELLYRLGITAGTYLPPYTLQFQNTPAWTYYFTHLLYWGAAPPLLFLGFLGLFVALFLFVRSWINLDHNSKLQRIMIPVLVFGPFYLMSAGQHDKYTRYILPLLPPMAIIASWLLSTVLRNVERISETLLMIAVVFLGYLPGLMYGQIYRGAVTPSYHGGITAFLHSRYVQKLPNRNNIIQNSRQKRS